MSLVNSLCAWALLLLHKALAVSDAAFDSAELQRAKAAIAKRDVRIRKDPTFVQQPLLVRLVEMARKAGSWEGWVTAMLFVTTYAFHLRLQSEALPISVNKAKEGHFGQQAVMTLEGEEMALPGHTSCPHVLLPFLAQRAKSHLLLAQLLADRLC